MTPPPNSQRPNQPNSSGAASTPSKGLQHDLSSEPRYVQDLLVELRDTTQKDLVVLEEGLLGFDSEARMANAHRPHHEIAYASGYRSHRTHFIVNGIWKFLRMWQAPPDDRYLPCSRTDQLLPEPDHAQLCARLKDTPMHIKEGMSRFLRQGLIRQVTSMPLDIRVERELHKALPEHRERQAAYLRTQVEDLAPHFDNAIASLAPDQVYAASTAMNVAFVLDIADLTGTHRPSYVEATPHRHDGMALKQLLHDETMSGHVGDRTVTDHWAKQLKIDAWYTWAPQTT